MLTSTAGPTVPCHNELLAGNFIDDDERVWLIDYDYSGNNDPCFELGNTSTECEFDPDLTGRGRRRTSSATTRGCWPGCVCRRCAVSTAGRCGGSSRPGRAQLDFDFHAWGLHRFEKARPHLHLARVPRLLDEVAGG